MTRRKRTKQRKKQRASFDIDSKLTKAVQYHQSGQFQQAEKIYKKILDINPKHSDSLHLLGLIAHQGGNNDVAINLINEAIHNDPRNPTYCYNLGTVFQAWGKLGKAIAWYQKALHFKPHYAAAYYNMGNAFKDQGKLDEAIVCYQKALRFKAHYAAAHYNMGNAFKDQGKLDEAISSYRKTLETQPDDADAYNNMGNALQTQGKPGEAITCYQKALEIKPDYADAYNNMGNAFIDQGKLGEAIACYEKALEIKPDYAVAHSNLLFALHYHEAVDPLHLLSRHRQWSAQHALPLAATTQSHVNDRPSNRCLRIGYVSPDFRLHSVAYFIEAVIASHDRTAFQISCYSDVVRSDSTTKHLKDLADNWRDIFGMSDEQVADLIHKDKTDILVDLAGHTSQNRLLVFARKPAPVQVTYLGYPDTTGLETMDYRITDSWADPPGQTEHLYTEELVRLPLSFLCYKPDARTPIVSGTPALESGHITFGSFNNCTKITPKVVRSWSRILSSVANSRLLLKSKPLSDTGAQEHLRQMFVQNGISSGRVEFCGYIPTTYEHLERYNSVDIALDTFPYNGTTTTCEAMWMGVPVIVLAGQTHASRVGVSLLSNVGLHDMIAESAEDYVEKAVRLAGDVDRLQELRAELRLMMAHSPLMDARGFTRFLETAYRQMWSKWIKETTDRRQKTEDSSERIGNGRQWRGSCQKKDISITKLSVSEQAILINQRGENLFGAGQIEEALAAFNKVVEIEPKLVVAHNNIGVVYWHIGNVQKALECFKKALEVDPGNENAILNLKEVLQSLKQASEAAQPSHSGLEDVCEGGIEPDTKETKPIIRILHNTGRCGGTVISKCLGCMKNIMLLSEIHPLGTRWFNPLHQARQWFNVLTTSDIQWLNNKKDISFKYAIALIHEKCEMQNRVLVIRDWSYLDFIGVPFLKKPSYKLLTSEILSSDFTVKNTAIVRHPIDQWLSLRNLSVVQGKITLEKFLRGYLRFAKYCQETGYVRYEDFTTAPEKYVERLCGHLSINFDSTFIEKWWQYSRITGDINSRRGSRREIKPVPRQEMEKGLLEQFQRSSSYMESIEILGYRHPI